MHTCHGMTQLPPPPGPPARASASFSIRLLRQPQPRLPMQGGTPATLSHTSSVEKQRFTEDKIFCCALLRFIPFLILIISKWCLFFLLFSLSHTSKESQADRKGMKCKVRVSISFCQTTIKCYGHIKAHRARWSAQWEYDILHCAGPHSGLRRQLQKNLTIRKNSL